MLKKLLITLACMFTFNIQAKSLTINPDESFMFYGEVNEQLAAQVQAFLSKANTPSLVLRRLPKSVTFIINSPGGSVVDGLSILDAMKASKVKINCVVMGMAASMAAITLEYCNERYATENSSIMFHRAAGGLQGSVNQMQSRLSAFMRIMDGVESKVAARLGMPLGEYRNLSNNEIWLINSKEAVAAKAIDEVAVVTFKSNMLPGMAPSSSPAERGNKTAPSAIDFMRSFR
jgi:ATP-dependent Clp protease, protease subunit